MKKMILVVAIAAAAGAYGADHIVVGTTPELEAAFENIAYNREIRIKEGHYRPSKTLVPANSWVTVRGVKDDGETPADRTKVILDGCGERLIINGSTQGNMVLRDLTISNGCNTATTAGTATGGGVYLYGARSVSNCVFACNRQTGNSGGALGVQNTTCEIVDCLFVDNYAKQTGGALYSHSGKPILRRCVFRGNTSSGSGAAYATLNTGGCSGIYDCWFESNVSSNGCGAVDSSALNIVSNTTFLLNVAKVSGPGALKTARNDHLAVYGCQFLTNSCATYGGAIFMQPDKNNASWCNHLSVFNSRFEGNSSGSGYYGGAIACLNNSTQRPKLRALVNSVFIGNTSTIGGALYLMGSSSVANCTFVGNEATSKGGAVVANDAGIDLGVTNCVFYGNVAPASGDIFRNGNDLSVVSHSYASTASGIPSDQEHANILGDANPFVGGATVGPVRPYLGRDAGLELDWMTPGAKDIAGRPRVWGGIPDMGAYEFKPNGLVIFVR